MSFRPTPKQTLALWSMLFGRTSEEREPAISKVRPALTSKDRNALVASGFLETERRKRSTHLIATDKAWAWAANHLEAELSVRSPAGTAILRNVLTCLHAFLKQKGLALADLIAASESPCGADGPQNTNTPAPRTIAERVRRAALEVASGRVRCRVRLAAIRTALSDVARAELDRVLLRMQQDGILVLYHLDNPDERTLEDEQAALFVAGNPRHILYLES